MSKQALLRAFTHHGLPQPPVFQGRPRRTRFYQDREAAKQAWRRAAEVGINQTRKELGVSDRALRTAWRRHGLGLPPRPASPDGPQGLDTAFLQLNRRLLPARERPAQELAAWVRREEEYATLGASVVVELNSEPHPPADHPRLGDHPPRPALPPPQQPPRAPQPAPPGRPHQPRRPHQPIPPGPAAGDGCRRPIAQPRPPAQELGAPSNGARQACSSLLAFGHTDANWLCAVRYWTARRVPLTVKTACSRPTNLVH